MPKNIIHYFDWCIFQPFAMTTIDFAIIDVYYDIEKKIVLLVAKKTMLKIFRFFGLYCKCLRLLKSLNFLYIKLIVYFIGYKWVSLPCFMLNSMTWLNIFVKECSLSTNHEKNYLHEQGQYVSIHHYFFHPRSHLHHSILTLNVKNMWLLTRLMLFTFIFFYHTSIFNMCL